MIAALRRHLREQGFIYQCPKCLMVLKRWPCRACHQGKLSGPWLSNPS